MRPMYVIAVSVVVSLAAIPASFAQSRDSRICPPGQKACVQQDVPGSRKGAQRQEGHKPANAEETRHAAPRIGDNGRGGQPFRRASSSRFKAPPRGQEYRVVDDHLVLVDSKTLKIVTIVGLLNTLLA